MSSKNIIESVAPYDPSYDHSLLKITFINEGSMCHILWGKKQSWLTQKYH